MTNTPELNVPLLEAISAQIADHPESFDMGTWCGTSQCIAGWAVALGKLIPDPQMWHESDYHGPVNMWYYTPESPVESIHVEKAAQEILGLTEEEAQIFYATELGPQEARYAIKELIESRQS